MPKLNEIEDVHHLARYVKKRQIIWHNGDPVGCYPDAFRLRLDRLPPEEYLSVTHLETYEGSQIEQTNAVAQAMKADGFDVKGQSGFSVGNVGEIRKTCVGAQLSLNKRPRGRRPAYTELWGVPQVDAVLAALGSKCWSRVILSSNLGP